MERWSTGGWWTASDVRCVVCCELRVTCYVLRVTCYVLRVTTCYLLLQRVPHRTMLAVGQQPVQVKRLLRREITREFHARNARTRRQEAHTRGTGVVDTMGGGGGVQPHLQRRRRLSMNDFALSSIVEHQAR